ncbi:MAG: hypothetical protein GY811_21605 [Myxococcales bacterium]|nr:hypothetical protein [Myxococcales bacterium]
MLVATGVLIGTSLGAKYAVQHRCDEDALRYLGMRVIIVGVMMAHLVDVFLYTPGKVMDDPLLILRFWEGISSYGGILGATLAFFIWAKRINANYLRYGDAVVYGFVPGFTFGRMGCATAHDHLGMQSDFFLAVKLPPLNRCPELKASEMAQTRGCQNWKLPDDTYNVTAHDLGLYEVFICAALFAILYLIKRFWTSRRPGTMIAVTCLYYAPIRFMLDFLRFQESDPHYLGLTPAQIMCVLTVLAGILTIRAMRDPKNAALMETEEGRAALKLPPLPGSKSSSDAGGAGSSAKPNAKAKPKAKITSKKRK